MRDNEQNNLAAVEFEESPEFEVDIIELLLRIAECWKRVAAGALIGALIMAAYSLLIAAPVYEATSKLYVLTSSDSAVNLSDLQIGAYLTNDYAEVFETWEVHEIVRQNLGLEYSRDDLSNMLTVNNPSDTRVLYITVRSNDPAEAAAIANEYASVARQYISSTMMTDAPSEFSEALVPEDPVAPRKTLNVIGGFTVGVLVMVAIIVVQFLMDDKIKTAEDIRRCTGLPTLAIVPDNDEANQKKDMWRN